MDTLKIDYDQFCRLEFRRRLAVRHIDALCTPNPNLDKTRASLLGRVANVLTFYGAELARNTGMLPEVAESDVWHHWERLFSVSLDALDVYKHLDSKADKISIAFLNEAIDYLVEMSESFPPATPEELAEMERAA